MTGEETSFEPRWYHFAALGILPFLQPYILGPWLLRVFEALLIWILGLFFGGMVFGG